MEEIKKIYKVYNGELVSTDVEKTTDKFFWIKGGLAFNCSSRVEKVIACVTPQEAAQEELNRALTQVGMYEDRLVIATARFKRARELQAELTV